MKSLTILSILLPFISIAQSPAAKKQATATSSASQISYFQKTGSYVSPIISINLKSPATPPAASLAKDELFWYKGKKVDDTTLITPQANLVRWSKSRETIIVQPKNDPFDRVVKEMLQTAAKKDLLFQKAVQYKSCVSLFPFVNEGLNKLDEQYQNFARILSNTIEVPERRNETAIHRRKWNTMGGGVSLKPLYLFHTDNIPGYVKVAFEKLQYQLKNYPALNILPPPSRDQSCMAHLCSDRKKDNNNAEQQWIKEMTVYERNLLETSIRLMRDIEVLGLKSQPEAKPMLLSIEKGIQMATGRLKNKSDLLLKQYGTDFNHLPVIIRFVLSTERQIQLLGIDETKSASLLLKIVELLDGYEDYIDRQMDQKNYDLALNLPEMISMERQRQLLGGNDYRTPNYIEKWMAFNRFKLDMAIDYRFSHMGECGESSDAVAAKMKKDYWLAVTPSSNCRYTLNTHEQNLKSEQYHFYGVGERPELRMGQGIRYDRFKNDDDQCETKVFRYQDLPVYPSIVASFDFCDKGVQDTVMVAELAYTGDQIDEKNSLFFQYSDLAFLETGNSTPEQFNYLWEEWENIQNKMDEIATAPEDHRKLSYEKVKSYHQYISRSEQISKALDDIHTDEKSYRATVNPTNGNAILIDATITINTHEHIDETAKAKFIVKVKVIHDPLPYKSLAKKANPK